jgi:ankyrin repeat protein
LLDAGARLDVRDNLLKSTPLGWACRCGRVEMVKLFLARGSDPVEAEAEPWATPRAWAEKMHWPEIVELLNATKSDPSAAGEGAADRRQRAGWHQLSELIFSRELPNRILSGLNRQTGSNPVERKRRLGP